MPRKIDLITELYRRTVNDITSDSVAWRAFLHSAAYQYKYPFADQVLIYAQKPRAVACGELELWNSHFGRWVNRGAKGIALMREKNGRHYLDHVFDVADTHNRDGIPFDIWGIKPEYEKNIIEALENRFGELASNKNLVDAVICATANLAQDNIQDYVQELYYAAEGSLLDDLDDDNLRVRLMLTVDASVAYVVLTRLGLDADTIVGSDAFEWVHEFNTPAAVNILGTATGDIAEICLREIEKTVKSLERDNRTFDRTPDNKYNVGENQKEIGGNEYDIDLQDSGERLAVSKLEPPDRGAEADRQVRQDEVGISQSTPQGNLYDTFDRSEVEHTSVRGGHGGEGTDYGDYEPTGDEPWGDGADENREPDGMGADDEQHQGIGGGGSAEQPDLRISNDGLPSPDADTLILALRHGDYLHQSKNNIVSFLRSDASIEQKTEYVKTAYNMGLYGEFYRPGTEEHIGYHAEPDSLVIYQGNYPSRTHEARFSWETVMYLIDALIKDKNYLDEPKAGQQLSMLDMPEVEETTVSDVKKPLAFSQSTIDEFIRLGGCTRQSPERIYGYYRRANDTAENVAFLKSKYENDSVGLIIDGKKMSAVWNEDGVRIAEGEKVDGAWRSVFLTWEDVDKRTRELIELGQYITNDRAEQADEIYENHLADKIAFLYREHFADLPDEDKTEARFVWPEITEFYKNILHDPARLEAFCEEMDRNIAKKEIEGRRHSSVYHPRFISMLTKQFLREPIEFARADDYLMPQKMFVTQDRIMEEIAGHHPISEGKFRVYSFFLKHKDISERADFLKKEYGTGGSASWRKDTAHDAKGLVIGYSMNFVADKVLLSWRDVAKRVDELIRKGKYMTVEATQLDDYERRQVASAIVNFFDGREGIVCPFERVENDFFGQKTAEALAPKLDDRELVERIVATMQEAFESEIPNTHNYDYHKRCYQTAKDFAEGKYNLFPGSQYRRKTPPKAIEAENKQEPAEVEKTPVIEDFEVEDYNLMLGTTVHIGTKEMELLSMSSETVSLFDGTLIPLDLPTPVFLERLRENPLNDHLKKEAEVEKADEQPPVEEPKQDFSGNPILSRYQEAKKAYPQHLAMVRVGDFYEFFGDDAVKVAKVLDIAMTIRPINETERIPMCGLPYHVVDKYLEKILDADLSVAIFEDGNITPREADNFDDINPEEIRENLAKNGIVDGVVVDEDALNNSDFIRQVMSDVGEQEPTAIPDMVETPKTKPKLTGMKFHPEVPDSDRHDYRITDKEIGTGGAKEKFRKNMAAIKLLHELEDENRLATPEEQEILAQYSGWGGLADAFDESKDNWHSEFNELYEALSHEEYEAAKESTLTAFYTPPVVIDGIYKALANMGFSRGNILEPSCGVGNFMGYLPESMNDSKIYGVELDSISGRIAQHLYQKQNITIGGFENTTFPDSFFDVAIGNVPFGQFKVIDKKYDKHNFLIHDYFFAKALDKVRPGGVIAFITSKGTLDKENPTVRKYLAQRADFIGAVRLPDNAFKGAGTEVVSDIIFLQKRDRIIEAEPDWVHLGKDENGNTMNQYFVDNPDMILGDMVMRSGPFGMEPTCRAYEGQDLGELLSEAVMNIHAEIEEMQTEELTGEEDKSIPADPNVKNYSFTVVDGKVYYRNNSRMNPVETSVTGENRIKGMVAIRDTVKALIDAQLENYPDEAITQLQARLNRQYDEFTKKYGLINSRGNASVFSDDNSYFLLCSLEILDENKELKAKADMFTKRTINPQITVDRVDTATEALAVSVGERAMVDMDYMSELTGKSEEELYNDLKGVIFRNPLYGNTIGERKYLMADEYLSGNVREKLKRAKMAAELFPDDYAINIEALERVQPQDLTAAEIGVRLGSTWIPEKDVQDFVHELLGTPYYLRHRIIVKFVPQTAQWVISDKTRDAGNVTANNTYGTHRINAYQIIEDSLNLKDVRIFDYFEDAEGKKKAVLNKKETTVAQGKQDQIKRAFEEWIWKEPARRERLCRLYNDKFNSTRPREFDGGHIKFYGMNPEIKLRKHQADAVARIMYGGNSLLAHVVGAGKTFTMVAAAQESKRLGLCNKSMFVVPNHLIEQWASEYLQLYPSANILVATKKDFETKNRKKFCARIATGDYDAVIIGHSQFEKIPMSVERQIAFIQSEINELMESIESLGYSRGDRLTVKQLTKTKKQLEIKLAKLTDQSRKDDVVTFEELGVDRLFIDEAHFYKNLAAYSKMRNVAGISQTEAQKSSDLYMKCRYLDELTGGKGCIFATGTPISNTMVELYTMQKYLQYDELRLRGLTAFDAWASTFGETVTAIELAPEGYTLIGR